MMTIPPSSVVAAAKTVVSPPRRLLGLAGPLPLSIGLAALVAVCCLALTVNSYYVFVLTGIALMAIVGIGLNVLLGLTGQVSFGHIGVYAIGAYTVAILTTRFGVSFWLAWPLAALLAGAMGGILC